MRFFCKKFLKFPRTAWGLLCAIALALLSGCSEPETDLDLYPDSGLAFWMFPNDEAVGDSVDRNLAHGVILEVHPNATYELSFDADEASGAPTLQLFRLIAKSNGYSAYRVRKLKASLEEGRYVYRFVCEENKAAEWAATLEKNDTYYTGSTKNVRLTGEGAYSDHLSLNLVLVGNVADRLNGYTVDELSQAILAGFRQFYTSIVIDTLYVNHAENHPVYGANYPANEPWVAGISDDDVMMRNLGGGWPNAENALDLILVHYISTNDLMGYSYLFSGNLGSGKASTVVLGANVKTSSSGTVGVDLDDVVETAVHESGHFFGLRHTSLTRADLAALGDYSLFEDGFTDTPYCRGLLASGLLKNSATESTDMMVRHPLYGKQYVSAAFNLSSCPDAENLMFPASTGASMTELSDMQMELVKKSLMIFPH